MCYPETPFFVVQKVSVTGILNNWNNAVTGPPQTGVKERACLKKIPLYSGSTPTLPLANRWLLAA